MTVEHSVLENGIHVLKTLSSQREVVPEIFKWLDEMQVQTPENGTLRYIIDSRLSGFPSLIAMYNEGAAWFKRNPNYRKTRTLFLNDNAGVIKMAISLASTLSAQSGSRWKWRIMGTPKYQEGINWLLADE